MHLKFWHLLGSFMISKHHTVMSSTASKKRTVEQDGGHAKRQKISRDIVTTVDVQTNRGRDNLPEFCKDPLFSELMRDLRSFSCELVKLVHEYGARRCVLMLMLC
jgi:hypothetical protein